MERSWETKALISKKGRSGRRGREGRGRGEGEGGLPNNKAGVNKCGPPDEGKMPLNAELPSELCLKCCDTTRVSGTKRPGPAGPAGCALLRPVGRSLS